MFLDLYKCLLVNTKRSLLFLFKTSLLEIYMWCSWTCTDVYSWTQKETCIVLSKTSLLEIYMWCSWIFCGTLEHLYLRFTCVGDDPGPVHMFTCEQKESFMVPWNLFTWDLHVMILDLYRCLLVNRNNLFMILQNIFVNKCTGSLQDQLFQSFGKESNLLALPVLIASQIEFYMSILLSKGLGITGIKSNCIIKILKTTCQPGPCQFSIQTRVLATGLLT